MFAKVFVVVLLMVPGLCIAEQSNGSRLATELWGIITDVPRPDLPSTTWKLMGELCDLKFKDNASMLARCAKLITDLEHRGEEIKDLLQQVNQASQRGDASHEDVLTGELADEAALYRHDFSTLNKLFFGEFRIENPLPKEEKQL